MIHNPLSFGDDEHGEWFIKFRDLVQRLTDAMNDLLGDEADVDTPALAVELGDTAWRWSIEMRQAAWNEGYAKAARDAAADRLGRAAPGNPYGEGGRPYGEGVAT